VVNKSSRHSDVIRRTKLRCVDSGYGGLEVTCRPVVPKFAGSNPAEAVGLFRADKNPQHAFRGKGSKAVGPMS
jgi:hypothetical protein